MILTRAISRNGVISAMEMSSRSQLAGALDDLQLVGEHLGNGRQADGHGVGEFLGHAGQEFFGRIFNDLQGAGLLLGQVVAEMLGDDQHGRRLALFHQLLALPLHRSASPGTCP